MAENTPAQKPLTELSTAAFMQDDPAWQSYAKWAERHVIETMPERHRPEARSALLLGYEAGRIARPRVLMTTPELPGHTMLPLSPSECDLIRRLRSDDVAATRMQIARAVADWYNERDPLLNEQIEGLTERILVAIERKS